MKLLRVGDAGRERPAALDATGRLRDLSHIVRDIDPGIAKLSKYCLTKAPMIYCARSPFSWGRYSKIEQVAGGDYADLSETPGAVGAR